MFLLIFSYSSLLVSFLGSKDNDGNLETFRYTQNQRRLETRTKKYNKIIEEVFAASDLFSGGVVPRPEWRPLTRFEGQGITKDHQVTDLRYVRN